MNTVASAHNPGTTLESRDDYLSILHDLQDEFNCPLCSCLLYEPITTSCGHTYCKDCIVRSLDHNSKCPVCRSVIHVVPEQASNILVQTLIQKFFPTEFAAREQEARQLNNHAFQLPLFLLDTTIFPNQPLHLHIFEPRYRLMIRRCLSGSKTFGLINSSRPGSIGTTVIIEASNILPDGRSILATRGVRRFKILQTGDIDGYKTAKVEYLEEEPISAETSEKMEKMIQVLKKLDLDPKDPSEEVVERFGPLPSPSSPDYATAMSFWIASIIPCSKEQRQMLLELTSTDQRFVAEEDIVRAIQAARGGSCIVS